MPNVNPSPVAVHKSAPPRPDSSLLADKMHAAHPLEYNIDRSAACRPDDVHDQDRECEMIYYGVFESFVQLGPERFVRLFLSSIRSAVSASRVASSGISQTVNAETRNEAALIRNAIL